MASSNTTTPDLSEELTRFCDPIVEAELDRLARKQPELSDTDLATITRSLDAFVHRLVVARAERLPNRSEEIRDLFGLGA